MPCVLQRPAEHELDLAVQTAQLVVRPALNGVEHLAVDPEQEWFPFSHDVTQSTLACWLHRAP